MLELKIVAPDPSRYLPNEKVDEIALAVNRAYREADKDKPGFPVHMDRLVDLLEVSTVWEDIDEPEGAAFFANYSPTGQGLITINEKHRGLFEARPDVYGACLGHELGHKLLRHSEKIYSISGTLSLFPDYVPPPISFHKSSWFQFGLSREEVQKSKALRKVLDETLVKNALISNTARNTLAQLHTHFEPDWMFWQAEHFSLCLRIPRDHLLEQLNEGWDFNSWFPIYRLAERFGVSASMMRLRLEKLRVIEIGKDGNPSPKQSAKQNSLFH
jgi:IrrE N-terminal-like domain